MWRRKFGLQRKKLGLSRRQFDLPVQELSRTKGKDVDVERGEHADSGDFISPVRIKEKSGFLHRQSSALNEVIRIYPKNLGF